MDLGIKGKLALVMGASKGIGRGVAEARGELLPGEANGWCGCHDRNAMR